MESCDRTCGSCANWNHTQVPYMVTRSDEAKLCLDPASVCGRTYQGAWARQLCWKPMTPENNRQAAILHAKLILQQAGIQLSEL